jgi:hypothetical protein
MRCARFRSRDDRAISGKLAAIVLGRQLAGAMPRSNSSERVQTIWSIRVPWPGGRAATTGGGASVASALLSFDGSGVLAALASEAVTGFDVVIGADVVIAELLIGRILGWPTFSFDTFSSREPASTSLENALTDCDVATTKAL